MVSFLDIAANYGEGPEAQRKGLVGPTSIGSVEPLKLRKVLRALQAGEISRPLTVGKWHLLIRLEQLSPSTFDEQMRKKLLHDQLEQLLKERSDALLEGRNIEPLHFDPQS